MTRSRPAAAPRTPETAPSVGLGNLTPAKPVLGHPRGGTGQVCSERGLTWDPAPWVRGVVGERLTCERAWVDQKQFQQAVEAAGGIYVVVTSPEEARQAINKIADAI